VNNTKASATAYPIQGLIKYHGLRDERLRLPYHDSISVCTAPLMTHTTIEFGYDEDTCTYDGKEASPRESQRILDVVNPMRELAGERSGFRMVSRNSFRSNIGLGASASGFAALALATSSALSLGLNLESVSRFARRGAGSASRAVTGGFSIWYAGTDDQSSYSVQIASSNDLDMGIVAALVPAYKSTEDAHRSVLSSPFFKARIEYVKDAIPRMKEAIRSKNFEQIGKLAELDTLLLHGITMTGVDELFLWRPETVSIILEVKKMRAEGLQCYFSIDTGATAYVNSRLEDTGEVAKRIAGLGIEVMQCHVGDEAMVVQDHLF
jgi:phosphomevalonate decarboxylase